MADQDLDRRAGRGIVPCDFLWQLFVRAASHERVAHTPCLGRLRDGLPVDPSSVSDAEGADTPRHFEWQSYGEVLGDVRSMAAGLVQHGIVPDLGVRRVRGGIDAPAASRESADTDDYREGSLPQEELTGMGNSQQAVVALCGPNSPSWIKADLALLRQAVISVPLSVPGKGASTADVAYVLRHAEVTTVMCGVAQVKDVVTAINSAAEVNSPEPNDADWRVATLVYFDEEPCSEDDVREVQQLCADAGIKAIPQSQLIADGRDSFVYAVKRVPEAIHTIMYTSGSTGNPKGAVLSERRWHKFMSSGWMMPDPLYHLSYAPLAHIMERQQYFIALTYGGRIGFACGDAARLFEDAQLFGPSYLSAAPRVWNEIHAQYKHALSEKLRMHAAKGLQDPYAGWQEFYSPDRHRYYHEEATGNVQWDRPQVIKEFEDDVMAQFRHVAGKRIQYIVTGGAAISENVLAFIRECFECPVFDGFGLTETGGVTTDGHVLPNVDAILEDLPELGYTNDDKPFPRGEICVKTPFLLSSYYKDSSTTSEAFTADGYFRTGDVGQRVEENKIVIIDRRKQVFKLTQGEFVAPERLEHLFITADLVDQIFVYGDTSRSQVVAVVSPNVDAARSAWERKHQKSASEGSGISTLSDAEFIVNYASEIRADLFVQLRQIGKRANLQPFEIPDHLLVVPEKWTAENGLMTPAWKLKRRAVAEKYRDDIEQLYRNAEDVRARIQQAIFDGTDFDAGDGSTSLRDMGFDSLGTVRLSERIKESFGTAIPVSILSADGLSAGKIAEFVWEQQQSTGAEDDAASIPSASGDDAVQLAKQDCACELPIPANLEPLIEAFASAGPPSCVLLTGATGFLGPWVLRELVETTDWDVLCLIRADSDEAASARLSGVLDKTSSSLHAGRVSAIRGDLGMPFLGLAEGKWAELASKVDVVLHGGAVVNWLDSYASLRAPNFLGTLEIIKLCTTTRLKPLHFVSSIGVAGHFESQMVYNQHLSALNGYSLTKYSAECAVGRAMTMHNLPISISRPGMITGHSVTGSSNKEDFVNRYLQGVSQLGAVPELADAETIALDMTPVDYVASGVVALCKLTVEADSAARGKVYHLINPRPARYAEIHHVVRAVHRSKGISPVPYAEWRDRVRKSSDNPLVALLPYFPESGFVMVTPSYNRDNANWLDATSGIQCPPADTDLLKTYAAALADTAS